MNCPKCGAIKSRVASQTPHGASGARVRRARQCVRCKFHWATYEIHADEYRAKVIVEYSPQYELQEQLEAMLPHALRTIEAGLNCPKGQKPPSAAQLQAARWLSENRMAYRAKLGQAVSGDQEDTSEDQDNVLSMLSKLTAS